MQILEKPTLQQKLEDACAGLFPAGSYSHCKGFHYDSSLGQKPSLEAILKWAGYPKDTPSEVLYLKHFLAPFTSQLPEYGLAEKTRARRFLKLQNILEDMLNSIRVYCVGEKGMEAIIIGETDSGSWAGIRTFQEKEGIAYCVKESLPART